MTKKEFNKASNGKWKIQPTPVAVVMGAAMFISSALITPTFAFEFNRGEMSGSLDTTLSYGLSYRLSDPSDDLVGLANGGTGRSVNGDDGNLNYDKGIISNVAKITSEVELNYRNYGAFLRATAFYDYENEDGDREKIPLTDAALDLVGSNGKLLDAYLWTEFDIKEKPAELRVGRQILSWGESTFIQNSINVINPVDVSAIRVPGAELREALEPIPMLYGSLGATENSSFEAFYQLRWQETIIDPPGSYFSTSDFAGEGGERVLLGFGAIPDDVPVGFIPPGGDGVTSAVVQRGPTRNADDDGQFGFAYRYFSPALNDTEFGFYYINYHSRLPIVNATTGTAAAAAGVDPNGLTYVETSRYYTSYPEDISLFGASFNTTIGRAGVALQGEVSHRIDAPLQIDDVEILFAALGAQDNLSPGNTGAAALAQLGQLGLVPFESDIEGFIERDITQVQMTATKLFGPTFGASEFVLLGEAAMTYVHDMPSKDVLRLDGPGTSVSGNPLLGAALHPQLDSNGNPVLDGNGNPVPQIETSEHFADGTSWGYRVVGRLDFNNAIGAVNLSPRLAWQHDVHGVSPGPGGNFIEGRKAITLGLTADYQNQWTGDLSYTRYEGAGRHNLIHDRDFFAANVKYSF